MFFISSRFIGRLMAIIILGFGMFFFQKSYNPDALILLTLFIISILYLPNLSFVIGLIWLFTAMNNYSYSWIVTAIEILFFLGVILILGAIGQGEYMYRKNRKQKN